VSDNLMNPTERLKCAPRCTAKAKHSGERCRAPAVRGWRVCRVHGAGGGAPRGSAHPNFRHGGRSRAVVEMRRIAAELVRQARTLCDEIETDATQARDHSRREIRWRHR
jgi:hypothetical protein